MSERKTLKLWANVYRPLMGCLGSVYLTKEMADQMAGRDRIACVEFEVRGGLSAALIAENSRDGGDSI